MGTGLLINQSQIKFTWQYVPKNGNFSMYKKAKITASAQLWDSEKGTACQL